MAWPESSRADLRRLLETVEPAPVSDRSPRWTGGSNGRPFWLQGYAVMSEQLREEGFARAVFGALHELYLDEGVEPVKAFDLALRGTRLLLLELLGVPQQQAAARLGVSTATAKRDAASLRAVARSGVLLQGRRWPVIPPEGVQRIAGL